MLFVGAAAVLEPEHVTVRAAGVLEPEHVTVRHVTVRARACQPALKKKNFVATNCFSRSVQHKYYNAAVRWSILVR